MDRIIDGRYRVLERLGEGAEGQVFCVVDEASEGDGRLTLKLLKEDASRPSRELEREFRILSELNHPNVVSVREFGSCDEGFYFTSDWIDGVDLLTFAGEREAEAIVEAMVGVLRGLAYVHGRGFLHFDVKPENILIEEAEDGPRARLLDFGLSAELSCNRDAAPRRGTPDYMAPEVLQGRTVDVRADIYSFGVALYEALTGRHPFPSRREGLVRGRAERVPAPPEEAVGEDLSTLLLALLETEPSDRPPSANDVIRRLSRATGRSFELQATDGTAAYVLNGRLVGRDKELTALKALFERIFVEPPVLNGPLSVYDSRSYDRRKGITERRRTRMPSERGEDRRGRSDRRQRRDRRAPRPFYAPEPLPENLVLLSGPCGIGKGRLLRELQVEARFQNVHFYEGRCTAYADQAYSPFARIIEGLQAKIGTDSRAFAGRESILERLGSEAAGQVEESDEPLADALTEILLQAARSHPMIIAITDLQNADPETVALVSELHRAINCASDSDQAPPALLVVGTYEPTPAPDVLADALRSWRRHPRVAEISLAPLGVDDVQELVKSMLGLRRIPRSVSRRIHEVTDGNPFLVEEVVTALFRDGSPDDWAEEGMAERIVSVDDLIRDRLAEVSGGLLPLRILAAADRPMTTRDLETLTERDNLWKTLRDLERRRILRTDTRGGELAWSIRHPRQRDRILEELEDREELHLQIARGLELLRRDRPEAVATEELARHYLLADAPIKGKVYCLAAARKAKRLGAFRQATRHYRAVLDFLDREIADTRGPRRNEMVVQRLEILKEEGDALSRAGCRDEALKRFEEIARRAGALERPRLQAVALFRQGRIHQQLGNVEAAERAYSAGLDRATEGEWADLGAECLKGLSDLRIEAGSYDDALTYLERSVELDRDLGDGQEIGRYLLALGWALFKKGEVDEALRYAEKALAQQKKIEDVAGRSETLALLSEIHFSAGRVDRAIELRNQSRALNEALGNADGVASNLSELGLVHDELGNLDDALEHYREAIRIWRKLDASEPLARILYNLGWLHLRRGELEAALFAFDESTTLFNTLGRTGDYARTLHSLARTYLRLGEGDRAQACHRCGLRLSRSADSPELELLARIGMSDVAMWRGERRRGLEILSQAAGRIPLRDCSEEGRARLSIRLGQALLWAGRLEEAETRFNEACERAEGLALAGAHTERAELRRRTGNWAGAWEDLEVAEAALPAAGDDRTEGRIDAAWARLLTDLGRSEEARKRLEQSAGHEDLERRLLLGELQAPGWASEDRTRTTTVEETLDDLEETRLDAEDRGRKGVARRSVLLAARIEAATGQLEAARRRLDVWDDLTIGQELARLERLDAFAIRVDILSRAHEAPVCPDDLRDMLDELPLVRARLAVAGGSLDDGSTPSLTEAEKALFAIRYPAGFGPKDAGGGLLEALESLRSVQPEETAAKEPTGRGSEPDRVARLLDTFRALTESDSIEAEFEAILELLIETTGASQGAITALDEEGDPTLQVVQGASRRSMPIRLPEPLLKTGTARFDEEAERLIAPILAEDRVQGAITVDGVTGEGERTLVRRVAELCGLSLEHRHLAESLVATKKTLSKKEEEIQKLNRQLQATLEKQTTELESIKTALDQSQRDLELKYNYDQIVGRSAPMQKTFQLLDKVTDSDVPVLVHGESGTGKELVARAVHFNGPRRKKRFVSINCAAMAESLLEAELFGYKKGAFTGADRDKSGLFEAADGGTLFLDEVGDMSTAMQAKLLRALQEGEIRPVGGKRTISVDVRIVAASNKDLKKLVEEGTFREDLFYRLNVVHIQLPPLRERREDIPLLVDHFLDRFSETSKEVSRDAMDRLIHFSWPGNVRQLENEVRRAVALSGDRIERSDLSDEIRTATSSGESYDLGHAEGLTLKEKLEIIERRMLQKALKEHDNNKTQTAKTLGLSRYGFLKKLDKYGLRD